VRLNLLHVTSRHSLSNEMFLPLSCQFPIIGGRIVPGFYQPTLASTLLRFFRLLKAMAKLNIRMNSHRHYDDPALYSINDCIAEVFVAAKLKVRFDQLANELRDYKERTQKLQGDFIYVSMK
jgi:hypothetical protein